MDSLISEEKSVIEAAKIFLLMKKNFPISRNIRAQWILDHLDTVITIVNPRCDKYEPSELEIISVIPKNCPASWDEKNRHQYQYKVSTSTSIVFLAHKYKMVFCLDLSPSLGTIDIQNEEIVMDEVCLATKQCLENISQPFLVPGSTYILQPEIYITIIVHTPFLTNPAQQVLIQGWLITTDNVNCLMRFIEKKLNSLEEKIALVMRATHQHRENFRVENDGLVSGLFDEKSSGRASSTYASNECISVISPDASFSNILRYGQLALSLLPINSCAHLVIVSDGIIGITDIYALDSVIQQFRASTVACSFIQIGTAYHPHCANGMVPYQDVLCFLTTATLGCHMTLTSQSEQTCELQINIYQENFLCWKLYRSETCSVAHHSNYWHTNNMLFYAHQHPQLLRKKQLEDKVICTLSNLMCCRLRDGYLIKKITLKDGCMEICFILPWKTHVFLEYLVSSPWPLKSLGPCKLQYTITTEAPYEFLHDITCLLKKPLKSQYRQSIVSRFWATLTGLTENNNMLEHFSRLHEPGWMWYNVPDTIKSGMPVFNLPAYPLASTLQLSDSSCPQFAKIWQPVASLDPNQWARWMHSQCITLVLAHDRPLPKYLHQANQSGRFQSVQSRQAAAALHAMLKAWASFVLVENHTYIQFIYRETEKPPVSFSVIRMNCKALCVVLNVAFAGGTEGIVRHNVIMDLINRLSTLTLPNRLTEQRETPCCVIIHKALEKILVRYERMPIELNNVILPDGTQQIFHKTDHIPVSIPTTTLCRYLHYSRYVWNIKKPVIQTIPGITVPKLNITAIARVLSTITKIRLNEGFNFAYSSAGIINMVLEVRMEGSYDDFHSCVIQYIIFPPHTISSAILKGDSEAEEDTDGGTGDEDGYNDDSETHEDYQIVTEVWIEPQYGQVKNSENTALSYMNSLPYYQLSNAISRIDEECINALLTLEHLTLLSHVESEDGSLDTCTRYQQTTQCGHGNRHPHKPLRRMSMPSFTQSRIFFDDLPDAHVSSNLFTFDSLSILSKCQQVELLYSMFTDSINNDNNGSTNSILMDSLMDHMKRLHNTELIMKNFDNEKFTKMLFNRPRDDGGLSLFSKYLHEDQRNNNIRWRCFIKGISATHIVITFVPATEKDVKALIQPKTKSHKCSHNVSVENLDSTKWYTHGSAEESQMPDWIGNSEEFDFSSNLHMCGSELNSSTRKTATETPQKFEKLRYIPSSQKESELILPIYVYNCSLLLLIDVLVGELDSQRPKDIFQNNIFSTDQHIVKEFINLKVPTECESTSPELKGDENNHLTNGQRSLLKHCKILSLAHCHCYVMAVYKALSLQLPMSYEDMEAAVEQCEESLIEINITKYLQTVCKHLHSSIKANGDKGPDSSSLTCSEFQPLHNLIKEKFQKIITVAFKPVPTHPEFYYCAPLQNSEFINPMEFHRSDSDEDLEEFIFHSEAYDCKIDNPKCRPNVDFNSTWPNNNLQNDPKMLSYDSTESILSDLREDANNEKEQPLFLQLSCSVRSGLCFSSIAVKLLPTCFADIKQQLDDYEESDVTNINISLDIICLNLPKEVLEVSLEQSSEFKTISYCSSSPVRSIDTSNESIPPNGTSLSDNGLVNERLAHLPRYQYNAITNLKTEIEWLLRDEITTALLDTDLPTYETLDYVSRHVAESSGRTSCHLDKVPLHFVFSSTNSAPKFFQELINMEADRYIIHQQKEFLYFVKNPNSSNYEIASRGNDARNGKKSNKSSIKCNLGTHNHCDGVQYSKNSRASRQNSNELPGCQSEISSIGDGHPGTDDGYEGDSSNSEDDCCWLTNLDERREYLPNFWLILQARNNYVDVYFHCRFLEFVSPEVDRYRLVQKMVVSQIAVICRRVNQYLLLESLHDTRNCDYLLESDSNEDHGWRAESSGEVGATTLHESTVNMTPGMFRCSIVWEETFCLHPRLKTGPGRSGLSRGIKALHVVLNRFSVNNRDNMFVYRESNSNVFYLRLHERTSDGKSLQNKLSESDERLMVSRSNSIASLSHSRVSGHRMDPTKDDDTRPRVRSFGEKDSDYMHKCDDSIVLMVHGISEPGLEVRSELVQVLHNRLDDAVLEVLSVMLARNPMCKLTPADVHFIQKPYLPPESYVQFSVQQYYLKHMDALAYYLRQNILQFLYIPKYTDPRSHYHLQDYSQPEGSKGRVSETDIFLNNQSQSSGNRGIACIAMAIDKDYCSSQGNDFSSSLRISDFPEVISTTVYKSNMRSATNPHGPIEFRIWKQGRVNLETLIEKLRAAINHAIWDLVTEYYLLRAPLNIPLSYNDSNEYVAKSNISNIASDQVSSKYTNKYELNSFELGKEGQFHDIYHKTLPCWFDFALNIGVSSVKKHIVIIQHRHPISMTVRELQNLIRNNAPDTSTRSFILHQSQPFVVQDYVSSETMLPFKQLEILDDNGYFEDKCNSLKKKDNQMVYIPCDVNLDNLESYSKAIVIARNFCQWKASYNVTPEPELLMPKDQKLLQKFNPLIQDSSFIPRQRLLLVKVQGDQFIIYMYNWSKERSEKLLKQATNLGRWLSSRSTLFSKIMMQKLGIFHHQLISSYNLRDDHAQQFCQMTDIEALAKFPSTSVTGDIKEWSRSGNNRLNTKNINYSWEPIVGQVMRDTKPNSNYPPNTIDSIVKAAYDLQDSHQRDRKSKEDLTRLYTLWQSRSSAPNIPISATNLNTFKQFSRLIHYCHTPILFLPQWRIQSAATRDHTLTSSSSTSLIATQVQSHNSYQQYGVSKLNNKKNAKTWHQELCISMISEYKQYLQLLGFNPLQVDSEQKKDMDEEQSQPLCYLKKSMLGGILLFELHMIQPFFTAKLRVIECNRLQTKSSTALVNQFMLSFVDASEKIKINMHLHSFTYDFHLRCIYSYIAGGGHWSLQQGYDLIHFLEDFLKYYSKAPNFARNLVDSDTVTVSNLTTPAHTLYAYLLSHERTYGMQVFGMTNAQDISESEYVLVRLQSTPLVSYCDAQDTKYTDDFTVALIVSKQDQLLQLEKSEITLKYYLLLTSKRELYPKRELGNNKLGKFRTVYNVVKTTSGSHVESLLESSPSATPTSLSDKSSRDEPNTDFDLLESKSASGCLKLDGAIIEDQKQFDEILAPTPPPVPSSPLMTLNTMRTSEVASPHLIQIRQESVNYLGYYSSHEQLMQQLIVSQARAARKHITTMIERGMLHCRTHLLWNKLLENKSTMLYAEFMELRSLARVESLSNLDSRLSPLVNQPINWYQSLAKVLQNKYQEHYKQFSTTDGNVIHHLILHPSYLQAVMMLTVDTHSSRGELYVVYRKSAETTSMPFSMNEVRSLIEGFINACCFHLWVGLCSQ